jgi:hypothetical protein
MIIPTKIVEWAERRNYRGASDFMYRWECPVCDAVNDSYECNTILPRTGFHIAVTCKNKCLQTEIMIYPNSDREIDVASWMRIRKVY